MLKYYKSWINEYENAEMIQTVSLLLFVLFFVSLILIVYFRPKEYYKKISELPLEDDNQLTKTLKKAE